MDNKSKRNAPVIPSFIVTFPPTIGIAFLTPNGPVAPSSKSAGQYTHALYSHSRGGGVGGMKSSTCGVVVEEAEVEESLRFASGEAETLEAAAARRRVEREGRSMVANGCF